MNTSGTLSTTSEMGDLDALKLRQKIAELELALANQTSSSNKEYMELEERNTKLRATFEKNELLRRKVEYELTAARKELNDEIRRKKQECDVKKKEVESCQEEINLKVRDIKSMEKVLHDQSELFEKERERLSKDIDCLSQDNSNLKKENSDLRGKIEDLINQCSVASVQISSKNVEIDYNERLRKDREALFEKEKETFTKELDELRAKNLELKMKNENISLDAKSCSDDFAKRYKQLEEAMSKRITDLKSVENRNEEIDREKESLFKEVNLLKQENEKMTKNYKEKTEELNEKCSLLETQRIEHTSTIHKLVEDNKLICDNEKEWIAKNNELQLKCKSLKENIEAERASHLESKFNSELLELKLKDIEKEWAKTKENVKVCASSLDEAEKKCKHLESNMSLENKNFLDTKEKLDKRINDLEHMYEIQSKELTNKSVALSNCNLTIDELKEDLAIVKSKLTSTESENSAVIKDLKNLFTTYGGKCKNADWDLKTAVGVLQPLLSDSSAQIKTTENNLEAVQASLEKLTLQFDAQRKELLSKNEALEEAEKLVKNVKYLCTTTEIKCSDFEEQLKLMQKEKSSVTRKLEQKIAELKIADEEVRTTKQELEKTLESTLSALTIMYDLLMTGAVQSSNAHSISMNELKDAIIDKIKQNINRERLKVEELDKYVINNKRLTAELKHHKKANRKLRKVNAGLLFQTEKYLEDAKVEKKALQDHLNEYNVAYKALENDKNNAVENWNFFEKSLKETQSICDKVNKKASQFELDNKCLLAAIVVISGGLWGLKSLYQSMCLGKTMLMKCNQHAFEMKDEFVNLSNMLQTKSVEIPQNEKGNQKLSGIFRFRVAVIAVLVANRFSSIFRHTKTVSKFNPSNVLFYNQGESLVDSFDNDGKSSEIIRWVKSNDMKNVSTEGVLQLLSFIENNVGNAISSNTVRDKIFDFYTYYLDNVKDSMKNSSILTFEIEGKDSLIHNIGVGLKKILESRDESVYSSISDAKSMLLKSIITSSVQHLSNEQEINTLKINSEKYRGERDRLQAEISIHMSQLEETEKSLKSHVADLEKQIEVSVGEDQFNEVCKSLNDALHREKNLQVLLKQQKKEISEITTKIEKQEENYQKSINIFTANLKTQQKEFQSLQGKMGGLKDILSKLEVEKEELNTLLGKEQATMSHFCTERDLLSQYLRKISSTLQKNNNKIDDNLIMKLNKLQELILPEKVLERDGKSITPEMLACQNTIVSLVESQKRAFQQVVSLTNEHKQLVNKISSLENGAKAHKINVQKLKSQISALCQDDSDFNPSMNGVKETSSPIFVPLEGVIARDHDYPRTKWRPCDPSEGSSPFYGRRCPAGQVCQLADLDEWPGPNEGITTFDDIILSMLTVFQCITLEGWSEIYWRTTDCYDKSLPIVSTICFIVLILVGSFFMLNLVLGVLSGEFAKERERVENRKSYRKLQKQHRIDSQVVSYTKWISKGADIMNGNDGEDSETENEHTSGKTKRCINFRNLQRRFRQKVKQVIKSDVFYWLVLLLLLLNTLSMATVTSKYFSNGALKEVKAILYLTEHVFTLLFFIEMCLRMYGHGLRNYFRSPFNSYDFVMLKGAKNYFMYRLRNFFICGGDSHDFKQKICSDNDNCMLNKEEIVVKNLIKRSIPVKNDNDINLDMGDDYIGWVQSLLPIPMHHQAMKRSKIDFSVRRNAVTSVALKKDLECLEKLLQHKMLLMHEFL